MIRSLYILFAVGWLAGLAGCQPLNGGGEPLDEPGGVSSVPTTSFHGELGVGASTDF